MREIELKFRIDDLDKLIQKLIDLGCEISDYKVQNDTIYVANLDNTECVLGSIFLRVRKVNDQVELTLKKQSANISESQEIEFLVSDYDKANDFLKVLGYKEWVRVNKKRRTTKIKEINICLDEVEKLGNFIELECLASDNESNSYEDKLLALAESLDIDTAKLVNKHYDTMIAELKD